MEPHDLRCPMIDETAYPICLCGVIDGVRVDEIARIVRALRENYGDDYVGPVNLRAVIDIIES